MFFCVFFGWLKICLGLCKTEGNDSEAFFQEGSATAGGSQTATAGGSQTATADGSHPATADGSHPATADGSHPATAGGTHGGITDCFIHHVKVSMTVNEPMTQTETVPPRKIWNFSKKGDNIGSILRDVLDPSQYFVRRYGRDYSYSILCFRTKQDADFVVNALHGKKVELPKKVKLSAEHIDEKPKVPKDKTAPAPPSPMKRCVLVKVQSDSGNFVGIRFHDISYFLYMFGTCPTSETPEEVSERQHGNPLYLPRKFDLKICHHVCKRDFLWLKFESEEKAQLAINKMHGQEFIRDEYDSSKYIVVVEPTDLKF
jgi:hypothetical protein